MTIKSDINQRIAKAQVRKSETKSDLSEPPKSNSKGPFRDPGEFGARRHTHNTQHTPVEHKVNGSAPDFPFPPASGAPLTTKNPNRLNSPNGYWGPQRKRRPPRDGSGALAAGNGR